MIALPYISVKTLNDCGFFPPCGTYYDYVFFEPKRTGSDCVLFEPIRTGYDCVFSLFEISFMIAFLYPFRTVHD